jgi:hypothetical protein
MHFVIQRKKVFKLQRTNKRKTNPAASFIIVIVHSSGIKERQKINGKLLFK